MAREDLIAELKRLMVSLGIPEAPKRVQAMSEPKPEGFVPFIKFVAMRMAGGELTWGNLNAEEQSILHDQAARALSCALYPDDLMLARGLDAMKTAPAGSSDMLRLLEAWQAMIGAAFEEEDEA